MSSAEGRPTAKEPVKKISYLLFHLDNGLQTSQDYSLPFPVSENNNLGSVKLNFIEINPFDPMLDFKKKNFFFQKCHKSCKIWWKWVQIKFL